MSTLSLGLLSGLFAAAMQSASYLGGRYFLSRAGNTRQLLIASIFICGVLAWVMVPFAWQKDAELSWKLLALTLLTNGGFVLGQWGFFRAQNHIESSRIASLLGLKVLVVMLFSIWMVRSSFNLWQYLAAGTTALSAMLMNWTNGKLDWKGMDGLAMALVGYALSDLGVQMVVAELKITDPIAAGMNGYIISYGVLGVLTVPCLRIMKISPRMLKMALPQAVCWAVAMWGLYVCFGLIGAAFGNVVQASRGLISLVIGIILSYYAIDGFEQTQSVKVWVRRSVAALMMFGAIVLFALFNK